VAAEQGSRWSLPERRAALVASATPDHVAGVVDNLLANALTFRTGSSVTLSCRVKGLVVEAQSSTRARDDRRGAGPGLRPLLERPGAGCAPGRQRPGTAHRPSVGRIDGGDLELHEAPGGGSTRCCACSRLRADRVRRYSYTASVHIAGEQP